ncbi:MAG: TldD/PmbA family protein [Myxococcota bacterium]
MNRRRFLANSGLAVVSFSSLAACAKQVALEPVAASPVATPPPPNPFYTWFGVDEARFSTTLGDLAAKGADLADLYFQHSKVSSITFEDGIIARAATSIEQGVGLRCVVGDQTGYAYTEDLSPEAMAGAARTAAAIAKAGGRAAPVEYVLGAPPRHYEIAVPWAQVGADKKIALVEKIAAKAKAKDPSITKVTVSWTDEEQHVLVVDLEGKVWTDIRPMSRVWCNLVATRNGVTVSNGSNLAGRRGLEWYTDEKIDLLVQQAADRTLILFDAKRPPAGEWPVILAAGASGILLHEAIGHGMEADFNRKGTSIYSTMIGQKVAPDFVTIVDDGTCQNERGALNFDDEGTPVEKTLLVEKGVMRSYLHDRISAKHYGVKATGSGRRESFRHAPMPRMRCTYMENGPHSRDEIVASVQKGIIAETFTNGQVQIGAGDFTFYIKNGWLVEGGKITAPIKDCNIIGNGPEALRNVTMAANDGQLDTGGWTCGKDGQSVPVSQGLPTVLVSKMTVGGV